MPSKTYVSAWRGGQILAAFRTKNYLPLGHVTLAIFKAARQGDCINLDAAFGNNRTDQKSLNDVLGLVLGLKRQVEIRGISKIVYTPEAAEFFRQNATARTNFAHLLKRCAQVAAGLLDLKAQVRMQAGTLVISGPKVQKEFGKEMVALSEKSAAGLKQKPSYAAIAAIAQRNRGIVPSRGSNTRGVSAVASSNGAFEHQCRAFMAILAECGREPTVRQLQALKAVRVAIDKLFR